MNRTLMLFALACLLVGSASLADYYDTQTGRWHVSRATLPSARGQTVGLRNAPDELLASLGIIPGVIDPVSDGMVHAGEWTVDVVAGVAHHVPTCITEAEHAAQLAAEAASELDRRNTPVVYDQPLELPSLVLQSVTNAVGYEYFVDDDGTLLSIEAHASPMKSKEERDALKAAAKVRRLAAKTDWQNNKGQGQLQKRIEALETALNELMRGQ